MARIELKDSIAALRKELLESMVAAHGEGLLFEAGQTPKNWTGDWASLSKLSIFAYQLLNPLLVDSQSEIEG